MYDADHLIPDQLRAAADSEPTRRRFLRIRAVLLSAQGRSAIQIANALGCSRCAVQGQIARYNAQGIDGLDERPRPGRPCFLDAEAIEHLRARQSRLRTLLLLVALVAILMGGLEAIRRHGQARRHHVQAKTWAAQAAKDRELADKARLEGNFAEAARWDRKAKHSDGWRKVFEHLASGKSKNDLPIIPGAE